MQKERVLHVKRPSSSKTFQARGQGSEVLLKAITLPSWKNSHQNHVTDSAGFRYSLRSQSNRNALGRELPIHAVTEYQTEKNASPRDMLSSVLSVTDVTAGTFRGCQRRKTKALQMPRLSAA